MNNLICQICGKEYSNFISLSQHIRYKHDISSKQYYNKYIKQSENEGVCYCGNQCGFLGLKIGYSKCCSTKCAQNDIVVRKKIEKTCIKKFGSKTNLTSKETINKIKQTNLNRYGVDNPFKSEKIKEKIKQTNLRKYGCENPRQNEKIKQKGISTSIKKYGYESPNQSDKIKQKKIHTCNRHYNVNYPSQSKEIQKRIKQTCFDRYGVDHYSKTIEGREICRIHFVERRLQQQLDGFPPFPFIGYNEPQFFEFLQPFTAYKIIRPDHMYGLFPDGYIEELNLVIEFDEPWHLEPWAVKRDKIKNETYKLHDLNIFRVPEKEWKENPDSIKAKFITLIESLQQNL